MVASTTSRGVFPVDDEPVVDQTGVDHHAHTGHAVDKPQAGIAHVVVDAVIGQSQVAMHQAGDGWLDVVLGDGCADQATDGLAGDARFGQHLFGRQGGHVAGLLVAASQNRRSRMPESPSMSPGLMPMRSSGAESCDSISAEVMIGRRQHSQATASMATWLKQQRFHDLPFKTIGIRGQVKSVGFFFLLPHTMVDARGKYQRPYLP
jgi:hypothetical protein